MKNLIVWILFVASIAVSSARTADERQVFKDWSRRFFKNYRSDEDEFAAMENLLRNKERIDAHNRLYDQGQKSYSMALTEHSDLTVEEVRKYLLGYKESSDETAQRFKRESVHPKHAHYPSGPSSIDWRQKGLVGPVENQRRCGACWAFSTAAMMYSLMQKQGKKGLASVQQLINCCHNEASGCQGGNPYHALQYIKENGIGSQREFPYAEKVQSCNYKQSDQIAIINEPVRVFTLGNETLMRDIVADVGPISIVMCIEDSFRHYSYGVYNEPNCCKKPDHAPMVVGYGTDPKGGDYWIVKNSWGPGWGANGYARVARNRGNMCNIAHIATYAT